MNRLLLLITICISSFSFGQSNDTDCATNTNPYFAAWTELKSTDSYNRMIKHNNSFYLRTDDELYTSPNINGPWTSLNFSSQTGISGNSSLRALEVLPNGNIVISTPASGVFLFDGSQWISIGLSGSGTNGIFAKTLNNNRLLVMKGGFLRDLYITDDSGISWTNVTNGNIDWFDIIIADNSHIFVCDGQGGLIKSTDNGSSFQNISSLIGTTKVNSISKDCQGYIYAVTDLGLLRSEDNGISWYLHATIPNINFSSHFSNFLVTIEGLYVLQDNTDPIFTISNDEGLTWESVTDYPGDISLISSITQIDGNLIVCAGDGVWAKSISFCTLNPPVVDLGSDTLSICGTSSTLDATNAAAGTYSWSNGETAPSITVNASGLYSVAVTDTNGCIGYDTTLVSVINPTINQIDTNICLGTTLILGVDSVQTFSCASANTNNFFNWSSVGLPGENSNILYNEADNTYYLKTEIDIYNSVNPDGPWLPLNYPVTNGNIELSDNFIGFHSDGGLLVDSKHDGIYRWDGLSWTFIGLSGFGSGGGFIQSIENDRILVSKHGSIRDLYITDNNGLSWTNVTNVDNDYRDVELLNDNSIICSGGSNTISMTGFILSMDNGLTWTNINNLISATIPNNLSNRSYLIEKDCDGQIFALLSNGSLYKSTGDANVWENITNNVPIASDINFRFEISNSGKFYVSSGNTPVTVYTSEDFGATWSEEMTFPIVNSVYNISSVNNLICIGTDIGLFTKNDHIQYDITWSTGDTSQNISVQPNETTIYTVTVDDGISSCSDDVTITLLEPTSSYQTETGIDSYTWSVNNETYTESGTYTAVIPNVAGCDSTITLDLEKVQTINKKGKLDIDF